MKHASAMRDKGGRYVFLIKAATSEVWWPEDADHIAFIRGRIGFELPACLSRKTKSRCQQVLSSLVLLLFSTRPGRDRQSATSGAMNLRHVVRHFWRRFASRRKNWSGRWWHEANTAFPPSVNTYWRHPNKVAFAGKSLISEAGRKFQSAACAAIIEQLRRLPKPTSAPASVEMVLFPPDNRIRDLDNYNKALFDALTHAGVWEDDSQVKRMLVEWGPVIPKGKVEITISKYEKTAGAAA